MFNSKIKNLTYQWLRNLAIREKTKRGRYCLKPFRSARFRP